jgi:hypothetical protein
MITISDTLACVLVAALKDSYERNCKLADAAEEGDVEDIEEFLLSLALLEGEVRKQYVALQTHNERMIPYQQLWPEPPSGPCAEP